jgi:hypothetical protein
VFEGDDNATKTKIELSILLIAKNIFK